MSRPLVPSLPPLHLVMASDPQPLEGALTTNNPFRVRRDPPVLGMKPLKGRPSGLKINTTEVVIAVTEATPSRQALPHPPPPARVASRRSEQPSTTGPSDGRAETATVTVSSQQGSLLPQPPVMRSMFPRYDPTGPLPPQEPFARPARDSMALSERSARASYTPSLYSRAGSPPPASEARFSDPWAASRISNTAPLSSRLRITEPTPQDLSSAEQLLDLWTVANGQESSEAAEVYHLGLQWSVP